MKWIDNNTISLEWSVEDVEQQLQDRNKNKNLSIKDCREVLERCLRGYNSEMGITWDHIDLYIDEIIEERKDK
tara:strand:+ start:221 stop:439 length:219 start_codon:yes stop_codon:yes gene_type:complete